MDIVQEKDMNKQHLQDELILLPVNQQGKNLQLTFHWT